LKSIIIPSSVEVLCESCFFECKSLSSVTFESGSRLQCIEESTFRESGLTSITIPSSVEMLCKLCFAQCHSIESITFENDLKLSRIELTTLHKCSSFVIISECSLSRFRPFANCQMVAPITLKRSEGKRRKGG
jgi:hypothetical protein